ncbi:MAG: 4-(cytidine 5'-diphospho)-2-C-methyl-D-erythritol kinase [Paracoccaceae bacterium]
MTARAFAPAKVNLTLHVTGKRGDGKHLLDSLVGFASVGDFVTVNPSTRPGLTVTGPEAAGVPTNRDNLVEKVATAFPKAGPLQIELVKNLPVASGIGGGSADAAACFRAICQLDGGRDDVPTMRSLLALGADIPMCVQSTASHIRGIGEVIAPVESFPVLSVVLANPRLEVSTRAVFASLEQPNNAPMEELPDNLSDIAVLIPWLRRQRNDLQSAAIRLTPEISVTLDSLSATPNCQLARMSGSGATCFGLYRSANEAEMAANTLQSAHSDWWVVATELGNQDVALLS